MAENTVFSSATDFELPYADTAELKSNQKNLGGIQKTFVISRKTLSILQKTAKDHKASRDALVEFSIQRLKPIIEQEKDKLESRRHISEKVKAAVESQKKLLDEATKKLGLEDPICEQLVHAMDRFESAYLSIEAFVQKSERQGSLGTPHKCRPLGFCSWPFDPIGSF